VFQLIISDFLIGKKNYLSVKEQPNKVEGQTVANRNRYLEMNPEVGAPGLAGCIKFKHERNYQI
jgi:hypothetical protein